MVFVGLGVLFFLSSLWVYIVPPLYKFYIFHFNKIWSAVHANQKKYIICTYVHVNYKFMKLHLAFPIWLHCPEDCIWCTHKWIVVLCKCNYDFDAVVTIKKEECKSCTLFLNYNFFFFSARSCILYFASPLHLLH